MNLRFGLGSNRRRFLGLAVLIPCLLFLMGCENTGDLNKQPYYRPLSSSDFFANGASARVMVPGTVPQTDQKVDDPALTGLGPDGSPFSGWPAPVTSAQVKRGQERFDIYCQVCHGLDGHSDGKAVTFGFPKPPDLTDGEVNDFPNGALFKVITDGQGKMFSYGYRVKAADRWAIIAYIRAMELKKGHLTADLTPDELQQVQQLGK